MYERMFDTEEMAGQRRLELAEVQSQVSVCVCVTSVCVCGGGEGGGLKDCIASFIFSPFPSSC